MKLFRPTEDTRFHIDYSWFEKNGQDINVLIQKYLTPEQQAQLTNSEAEEVLDSVDEETGEVHQMTRLMYFIRAMYANDPSFINPRLPLAELAFRVFLVNGNQPLTANELAARIGRKPAEVLAQLGGRAIYNGICPILN
jgi:hypothetical protein